MFQTNNLGKSVNYYNYSKIKKVFEYVNEESEKIHTAKASCCLTPYEYLNYLLNLFNKTIIGINPELFSLYLSLPKIIVRPIEKREKEADQSQKDDETVTNKETELETIIKDFNNLFVLNQDGRDDYSLSAK